MFNNFKTYKGVDELDKKNLKKKKKEENKTYKDPHQTFGRPKKHTDLEQYAIYREWQERGKKPLEQIALDNKISMSTLRKYIMKYENQKKIEKRFKNEC